MASNQSSPLLSKAFGSASAGWLEEAWRRMNHSANQAVRPSSHSGGLRLRSCGTRTAASSPAAAAQSNSASV
ncbi:hypothetical protein [Pseudoduganella sp. UC29_71]|uniref:hypothetical protein n=1 Tax=Pseudoduganella sp. UC29_71 TaxID=3350174 RepID=UPI00366DDD1C